MQNNYQTNQQCITHNKKLEYYCLDSSCKIDEIQCYICIAQKHSKCDDQTIMDEEEVHDNLIIDQLPQNYIQVQENLDRILENSKEDLKKQLKDIWLQKLSSISKQQQKNIIDFDQLLENKKDYKIVSKEDNLYFIKNERGQSLIDYQDCEKKIKQNFNKLKKKISKLDLKIPDKLSRHNFIRDKKEIRYKQQANKNQAIIKTGNFYSVARILSKFPWKNFILEFNLTDKSSQRHELGFQISNDFFMDNFAFNQSQILFSIVNNKQLTLKLNKEKKTLNKPITNELKGYFKDENQTLSLYFDDLEDAIYEVKYEGNLFLYFKADKQNVSLFFNLIK